MIYHDAGDLKIIHESYLWTFLGHLECRVHALFRTLGKEGGRLLTFLLSLPLPFLTESSEALEDDTRVGGATGSESMTIP